MHYSLAGECNLEWRPRAHMKAGASDAQADAPSAPRWAGPRPRARAWSFRHPAHCRPSMEGDAKFDGAKPEAGAQCQAFAGVRLQ
jgi:hypothetical protein